MSLPFYWLIRRSPFILPFEDRQQYFHSTAFGLTHALSRLQSIATSASERQEDAERQPMLRTKFRISREMLFESAKVMLQDYAESKTVVEVEFFNEVGGVLSVLIRSYLIAGWNWAGTNS